MLIVACYLLLCWMSLSWVSLWRVLLCWVSWRHKHKQSGNLKFKHIVNLTPHVESILWQVLIVTPCLYLVPFFFCHIMWPLCHILISFGDIVWVFRHIKRDIHHILSHFVYIILALYDILLFLKYTSINLIIRAFISISSYYIILCHIVL